MVRALRRGVSKQTQSGPPIAPARNSGSSGNASAGILAPVADGYAQLEIAGKIHWLVADHGCVGSGQVAC